MKKNIIILVCTLFSFSVFAQAQKNFIDQNYIEVKGTANLEIVPDEIYVNIHLNENDTKQSNNLEKIEKQMFAALKKLGIDLEKQLSVADYSGNLQRHFWRGKDVKRVKDFELLLHDATTLAKVFIELDKMKISNINVVKVDHSEIEKYRQEVKVKAVKAGKKKAKALAEAIDQNIGRAIYINELSNYYGGRAANAMYYAKRESLEMADSAPNLEFQKIKLEYTVQLRFELK